MQRVLGTVLFNRGSLKVCSVMHPFNCISKIAQEISAPGQAASQDEDQCIDNETAAWHYNSCFRCMMVSF